MSTTTDDRIVRLELQSTVFETAANKAIETIKKLEDALKLEDASSGLEDVMQSVEQLNMDSVSESVEECSRNFGQFEGFVNNLLNNISNRMSNFAIDMAKKVTIQPLMDGFSEYELQMNSVQTILSNAGEKLKADGYETQEAQIEKINATLDELNEYADKTIYNFSEMTRNIGTFTAAGVDLDTATESIQGIANLAAASGSNSQQASTAMYQLSQAIAAGALKLQDWNSVVNAGMGGELFQNALKRTARVHGVAVDEMIADAGSFRESLSEGWITADILTETLGQLTYTYDEVGDAAYNAAMEQLKEAGYSKEDAEAILELAKNAQDAATKVRTWSQLWGTVGEALGSGWAATWRTVVGDFLEATELFTWFSDRITGVINASSEARNAVLENWAMANEGAGRKSLVDTFKNIYNIIAKPLEAIGKAFSNVFGISARQLYYFTTGLATFTKGLVLTKKQVEFLTNVFTDAFRIVHSVIAIIANVGKAFYNIFAAVFTVLSPFLAEIGGLFAIVLNGVAWLSEGLVFLSSAFEAVTYHAFYSVMRTIYDVLSNIFTVIDQKFHIIMGVEAVVSKVIGIIGIAAQVLKHVLGYLTKSNDLVLRSGRVIKEYFASPLEYFFVAPIESALSSIENFVQGFANAEDKVAYVGASLSSSLSGITDKVSTFYSIISQPSKVYEVLETLGGQIEDAIYRIIPDKSLADKIHNGYMAVAGPIHDFFSKTLSYSKSWKDAVYITKKLIKSVFLEQFHKLPKPVQEAGKAIYGFGKDLYFQVVQTIKSSKAFSKLKEVFGDLSSYLPNYLTDWDAFKQKASEVVNSVIEYFGNLNSSQLVDDITSPFKKAWSFIKGFFDMLSLTTEMGGSITGVLGKTNAGSIFSGIFGTLVESIKTTFPTLSSLFSQIVDTIGYGSGSIVEEARKLSFQNVIDNFNLFIDFIESIPDRVSTAFDELIGKFEEFFSNIPWPSFEQLEDIGKKVGKALLGKTIVEFVKSLTSLNKTFSGMGKGIIEWPTKFGDALSRFGEGFNKWKKETKADAFVKIAKGILILAGALFLVASIPSDDLIKAGTAIGIMAGAIAGFFVVFGLLDKFKLIESSAISNLGDAIQGIGIGILALSGACLVLSQIPIDDLSQGLIACIVLVAACSIFARGLGADGKSMKSGSIGLIAFAAALYILTKVVDKLGNMDLNQLIQGVGALSTIILVLTVFGHFAAEQIGNLLASVLKFGAGVVLIGVGLLVLVGAILALNGVITSFGTDIIPSLALIAAYLLGFMGVCLALKNSDPVEAGLGLIAFSAGLVIMAGALFLMSSLDLAHLIVDAIALASFLGIFAAMTAKLGGEDLSTAARAILEFAAALAVMSVSLGLMSVIPWTGLVTGGIALGVFLGAFSAMAYFLDPSKTMGIAQSLLVFSASVGVMTLAFLALQAVNFDSILPSLVAIGVLFAGFAVVAGLLSGVAGGVLMVSAAFLVFAIATNIMVGAIVSFKQEFGGLIATIGEKAGELYHNFIDPIKEFFGINSPSKEMEGVGNDIMAGLVNGIGEYFSNLTGSGEETGTSFLDGLDDLPSQLGTKASDAITEFTDNLKTDEIIQKGEDIVKGLIEGIKGPAYEELRAVPGEIFNTLGQGIADLFQIQSPSGYMRDVIGANIMQGLLDGIGGFMSDLGTKAGEIFYTLTSGIVNVPGEFIAKASEAGSGLVNGIGNAAGAVGGAAIGLVTSAASGLKNLIPTMSKSGDDGAGSLVKGAASQTGKMKTTTASYVTNAKNGLSTLSSTMNASGTDGANSFSRGLSTGESKARHAAKAMAQAARSGASGVSLVDVGQRLADGLAYGIAKNAYKGSAAMRKMVNDTKKTAKVTAEVKSPSRVFMQIGAYIAEGLAIGIEDNAYKASRASEAMASALPEAFNSLSLGVEDLLDTDYNPVISPVIDPTQFNYSLNNLSSMLNTRLTDNLAIGNLNYNGEIVGKFDEFNDMNKQALEQMAANAIDYDRLGASVANALIASGVHVEMDGGQLMGYLAGEIADTRRMFGN